MINSMKNVILTIAILFASVVSAQDLSINIQEKYFSAMGVVDSIEIIEITNIKPTAKAWDRFDNNFPKMKFGTIVTYKGSATHTWTEQGVYVIACRKDDEWIGGRTFVVINEKYVDFVLVNLPGMLHDNTFVRSEVELVGKEKDNLLIVK